MPRVIPASDIDLAVDLHADVAEGPVWDLRRRELVWVDIPRGVVHRWQPTGSETSSLDLGQPVGALALRESDGYVVAVRDGFGTVDRQSGELRLRCAVEDAIAENRMNDGGCDSAGRFWAGTMHVDMLPGAGSLYRLEADYAVSKMLDGLAVSNGLAWSLDDRTLYFIDSLEHGVDAFDYEAATGEIAHRRRVTDVPPELGLPDGMTIDGAGYLWVALWDGWSVRRFAPDGSLDMVIELPTAQITSCAFGGEDLDELYVTSAAAGLSAEQLADQPHAGAVFCVRPGVVGVPAHRFGG